FRRFHEVSADRVRWVAASSLPELFAKEGADAEPIVFAQERMPARPEPAKPVSTNAPPPPSPAEWHYVAANGVAQGPVGRDHLLGLWNQGKINAATLVWKEGMANWLPATSPETGLALPRSGWRSAHRVWIGVAAAALCLLLAGLSYAAYKYWWRG